MSERFEACLAALGAHLGITLTTEGGVASLTLDANQTIHLAALGESQLAMFMRFSRLTDPRQAVVVLQHNLFSVDPARPRVALSSDHHLIVWSQHPLSAMDASQLYQALSTLRDHASEWLSDEATQPPSSNDLGQSVPLMMV